MILGENYRYIPSKFYWWLWFGERKMGRFPRQKSMDFWLRTESSYAGRDKKDSHKSPRGWRWEKDSRFSFRLSRSKGRTKGALESPRAAEENSRERFWNSRNEIYFWKPRGYYYRLYDNKHIVFHCQRYNIFGWRILYYILHVIQG